MAIRRERVGSGGAPTVRSSADHILPQSFAADTLTVDRPAQDMPAIVDASPGKRPLVRLSDQPPNYETPIRHLGSAITPADAFFVRYYRVPRGRFPGARFASQENADDVPVTEILVNSLITSHQDGDRASAGSRTAVAGIAWDGGHGIRHVEVSTDGGDTWVRAELGQDLGRFAFRPWSHDFIPRARGKHVVLARATSMAGHRQPAELIANPGGYHHNAISAMTLTAM